jgi:hypothetical protein
MPRPAPPRRTPPPRRKVLWLRAAPIFVGMMALLFAGQYFLLPMRQLQGSFLTANGGLALSIIAGIVGAFAISRFATVTPPPPPSKSQQRKLAAAARSKNGSEADEDEEEELAPARAKPANRRRRRRR